MVSLADYLVVRLDRELQGQTRSTGRTSRRSSTRPSSRRGSPTDGRSPRDLRALLEEWTRGFVPLNTIEETLSELIDARATGTVERVTADVGADEALALLEPGDILVDCTGSRSLMRDLLLPGDDLTARAATRSGSASSTRWSSPSSTGQQYVCNEYCKYYKNRENTGYKFIPAVHRTYFDGDISHVTGIVSISRAEFEAMPPTCDGAFLREQFPGVAAVDGPVHRPRQGGDERRSGGRPRHHPDPARRLPRTERHEPAVARVGRRPPARERRRSSCSATPRSARPTSSRSPWASSARSSSPGTSRTATCRCRSCSIATSCSCTSSGSGCTCAAR